MNTLNLAKAVTNNFFFLSRLFVVCMYLDFSAFEQCDVDSTDFDVNLLGVGN
jgi:hypothetical protein